MTKYADSYVVTEPGMTSLQTWQMLSADELDHAETQFGPSAFAVLPSTDILDAWISEPMANGWPSEALSRLIVIDALSGEVDAAPDPIDYDERAPDDEYTVELCRQALAQFERIGRLRDMDAPGIVLRNERRMLKATARALFAAAAQCQPPVANAA